MTLKDDFRADLSTFFNLDELATLHWLNGVLLPSTARRYTERLSNRQSEDYDAIHGESIIVEFRAEDFLRKSKELPREKHRVKYDDGWYDVTHAEVEYGVCRLVLTGNKGAYR